MKKFEIKYSSLLEHCFYLWLFFNMFFLDYVIFIGLTYTVYNYSISYANIAGAPVTARNKTENVYVETFEHPVSSMT